MAQGLKVAVVGTTGMVGAEMLRVLEQRDFPVSELVPVASARSAGKTVRFKGSEHAVVQIAPDVFQGVDLALFSAGGGTSRDWSPIAASKGALVVDNSSAFRADPECPLVVPEVNASHLELVGGQRSRFGDGFIVTNPNCSTTGLALVAAPLNRQFGVRRLVVATLQAVSGAGAQGDGRRLRPAQAHAQARAASGGASPSGVDRRRQEDDAAEAEAPGSVPPFGSRGRHAPEMQVLQPAARS